MTARWVRSVRTLRPCRQLAYITQWPSISPCDGPLYKSVSYYLFILFSLLCVLLFPVDFLNYLSICLLFYCYFTCSPVFISQFPYNSPAHSLYFCNNLFNLLVLLFICIHILLTLVSAYYYFTCSSVFISIHFCNNIVIFS
jgi:hypothetical protein